MQTERPHAADTAWDQAERTTKKGYHMNTEHAMLTATLDKVTAQAGKNVLSLGLIEGSIEDIVSFVGKTLTVTLDTDQGTIDFCASSEE